MIKADGKRNIYDLTKNIINDYPILAAYSSNQIRAIDYIPEKDELIDPITITSEEGRRIYQRGILFVFYIALKKLFPERKMNVIHSISKGIYIIIKDKALNEKDISLIKKEMKSIIKQDIDINRKKDDISVVKDLFNKEGIGFKNDMLSYKSKTTATYYKCGDYIQYFFGYMPPSTGCVSEFEIVNYEPGIVLMHPSSKFLDRATPFVEQPKLHRIHMESENWAELIGVSDTVQLNKIIKRKEHKMLIEVQEALQEKKISEIAQSIKNQRKRVVLISGPSSSGKTTFTHRLKVHLKSIGVFAKAVSLDNYFVDRHLTPLDKNGNYDFECLEALELKMLNRDIHRLLDGEEIGMPIFDFEIGKRNDNSYKLNLKKDEIIIFEGIHAINERLTSSIFRKDKFKIYISALTQLNLDEQNRIHTTDNRLIRRMIRDERTRGQNASQTLKMWSSVRRGEEKHIFPYQEDADILINSALSYELAVLKKHAMKILLKIGKDDKMYSQAKRLMNFLQYFESIDDDSIIPSTSILKEFIGG